LLQIYLTSSRGQPTRGGPPAWRLSEVLINLHRQKWPCYETCIFLSHSNYWHLNSRLTVASTLVSRRISNGLRVFVVRRWQLPWRRCFLQIACQPLLFVASKEVRVGAKASFQLLFQNNSVSCTLHEGLVSHALVFHNFQYAVIWVAPKH
jgi:hypothetical protein